MSDQQQNRKTGRSLWLSRAALGFVALAAVMGWGASFVGLHAYGQVQMVGFSYWTAWLIPATFDGAAFGATLITYRASIYGRSAFRGRVLMWVFTGISSWINWIHQTTPEARIVAAGLPVAAVAVFDVVLAELRADFEERHGKRRLRLRPGLLFMRWLVDREGTALAFRRQVTDIPVSEIAGLGSLADHHAPEPQPALEAAKPPERAAEVEPEPQERPARAVEEFAYDEPEVSAESDARAESEARSAASDASFESDVVPSSVPYRSLTDPDAQTVTLPPVPSDGLTDEDKRTFARRDYRLSLEAGEPLTGAQLSQRYGFSERWGRRQIAAVRVEMEDEQESSSRSLVSVNG